VNSGILQSTLRELKGFAGARNLWLTFGAIVLLFAVTGPFGTMDRMHFLPRLGYWLILHAAAWGAAMICVVLADVLLRDRMTNMFWRMMTGAILAAIPIGAITQMIQLAWFGRIPNAASLATEMVMALPLCIIFCVISFMTMSSGGFLNQPAPQTAHLPPPDTLPAQPSVAGAPAPLLQRLKPENRGRLQHLAVEDHYTFVRTSRGRELILLRFSDALRETGGAAGLQVHRSHWVADDFVTALNRTNGKLSLSLADGTEIPVSRTYAADVRARFD